MGFLGPIVRRHHHRSAIGQQRNSIDRYNKTTQILKRASLTMTISLLPKLQQLPISLPIDGAVRIELEEGIPIFRASSSVQSRIEILLAKQQDSPLQLEEEQELDCYEEIDDYLSFVNRTIRNL
jgi:hypothetical protein